MHAQLHFSICTKPGCSAWPVHGHITAGSHGPLTSSPPIFSKEVACGITKNVVTAGRISADEAGTIDAAIRTSGLPESETGDDRLFQKNGLDIAGWIIDRRYGVQTDEGSGETRIERCEGACEHGGCGRYPVHAMLYAKGVAQPNPRPLFSYEAAQNYISRQVAAGILLPKDEEGLIESLGAIKLEKKAGRADRLGDKIHDETTLAVVLGRLHEATHPERNAAAAFNVCGHSRIGTPGRHGHLTALGCESEPVLSVKGGDALLMKFVDFGLIDQSDSLRVLAQIEGSGLPQSGIDDHEAVEGLLHSINKLFGIDDD